MSYVDKSSEHVCVKVLYVVLILVSGYFVKRICETTMGFYVHV